MYELTAEQIDEVSGAINWTEVAVGASLISLGIAFTVVSGGTGAVAIGVIVGAGTSAEIAAAAAAIGLSALGGYAMGEGFVHYS
jgi:hypothetical protein